MKKLVLAAAISAIVSGSAFAVDDVTIVSIPDAALAVMGSVAASGGATATSTEFDESFNSILSGNKAFSDNTFTSTPTDNSTTVKDNTTDSYNDNLTAGDNAVNVNGDVEKGGMVQAGHDNLQAGDDITVKNVSANGVASNQQSQIGGGGYGYWGLPSSGAQQQGQQASTDNTAIGGDYAPKSVLATGNGIATGFGSEADVGNTDIEDSTIVSAPNSGIIAGDDVKVEDSAVVTAPHSQAGIDNTDNSIEVEKGGTLAQGGSTAVGDDQTIDSNKLIVKDNNLAVDSFNDSSTDVAVDVVVKDNVVAIDDSQAASKGGENEVETTPFFGGW